MEGASRSDTSHKHGQAVFQDSPVVRSGPLDPSGQSIPSTHSFGQLSPLTCRIREAHRPPTPVMFRPLALTLKVGQKYRHPHQPQPPPQRPSASSRRFLGGSEWFRASYATAERARLVFQAREGSEAAASIRLCRVRHRFRGMMALLLACVVHDSIAPRSFDGSF